MQHSEARANVLESMKSGSARILDSSVEVSQDELVRIAVAAQQGEPGAWSDLVNATSRLVFRLADTYYMKWREHLPAHASFCDVFSEGLIGLHRALEKFDAGRELAFTTPAVWWIRNSIQRAVYAQIGVGHVPERIIKRGLDPAAAFLNPVSLDYQLEDGRSYHERIPAMTFEQVGDLEQIRSILEVLGAVDSRLPRIAELAQQDYTLREVGEIVGVTGDRVRQLLDAGARAVTAAGLADRAVRAPS